MDTTAAAVTARGLPPVDDRAVLHFLTDAKSIAAYQGAATDSVRPGSIAIIAGFGPDGPERCSGLTVARRSAADIATFLGRSLMLVEEVQELHRTPSRCSPDRDPMNSLPNPYPGAFE